MRKTQNDIICAPATPVGTSAIGVVRISGENSLNRIRAFTPFLKEAIASHTIHYGFFIDPKTGEKVDEVLVSFFEKGRSYTGEESLEISFHGNPRIIDQALTCLISSGVRLADPGEFTFRAFMNGRLDLARAEGVYNLIHSQGEFSTKAALRQIDGEISQVLLDLENKLFSVLAHIEADIDFSVENLETLSGQKKVEIVNECQQKVKKLLESFKVGRILNEGIRASLIGAPNVGKSSLFNQFVGKERSIVTELPGTTRDIVSAEISVKGIKVSLCDTAGIRDTDDFVEKMGVSRSKKAIGDSDILLLVFDLKKGFDEADLEILCDIKSEHLIVIGNKKDLISEAQCLAEGERIKGIFKNRLCIEPLVLFLSTIDGDDCREKFFSEILSKFKVGMSSDSTVLLNARHFECLSEASEKLLKGRTLLSEKVGDELAAMEIRDAITKIGEVLGKSYDEEVIDKIFKEFCLGK